MRGQALDSRRNKGVNSPSGVTGRFPGQKKTTARDEPSLAPGPNRAQESPMRDPDDPSTPPPRNAFAEEFLRLFEQEDEPASAAEADVAGPWEIQPSPTADGRDAFGLWRLGERPDWGHAPAGLFRERSTALLAAAVRPFLGREAYYELGRERWNGGFPLLRQGEAVGWIDL